MVICLLLKGLLSLLADFKIQHSNLAFMVCIVVLAASCLTLDMVSSAFVCCLFMAFYLCFYFKSL